MVQGARAGSESYNGWMRNRLQRKYPDEWPGFKMLPGATLAPGEVVELVGAEATPFQRWIGVRRVVDGDYRCYGGIHPGVPVEWLPPRVLRALTPAAEEFLALFAEPE
jgi:hypothetical protein